MKTCTKCGRERATAAFSKRAASKDGLCFQCKDCAKASSARWRKAHPEQVARTSARYSREHAEQISRRSARWRREHPERAASAIACWQKEHPKQIACNHARWAKKHPERNRVRGRRRRARQLAVNEQFTSTMETFVCAFWGR